VISEHFLVLHDAMLLLVAEAASKKQGNESVPLAALHVTSVSSYLSQVVKSTHLAPFDEHFFSVELHPK
jgi:hypothetical protein